MSESSSLDANPQHFEPTLADEIVDVIVDDIFRTTYDVFLVRSNVGGYRGTWNNGTNTKLNIVQTDLDQCCDNIDDLNIHPDDYYSAAQVGIPQNLNDKMKTQQLLIQKTISNTARTKMISNTNSGGSGAKSGKNVQSEFQIDTLNSTNTLVSHLDNISLNQNSSTMIEGSHQAGNESTESNSKSDSGGSRSGPGSMNTQSTSKANIDISVTDLSHLDTLQYTIELYVKRPYYNYFGFYKFLMNIRTQKVTANPEKWAQYVLGDDVKDSSPGPESSESSQSNNRSSKNHIDATTQGQVRQDPIASDGSLYITNRPTPFTEVYFVQTIVLVLFLISFLWQQTLQRSIYYESYRTDGALSLSPDCWWRRDYAVINFVQTCIEDVESIKEEIQKSLRELGNGSTDNSNQNTNNDIDMLLSSFTKYNDGISIDKTRIDELDPKEICSADKRYNHFLHNYGQSIDFSDDSASSSNIVFDASKHSSYLTARYLQSTSQSHHILPGPVGRAETGSFPNNVHIYQMICDQIKVGVNPSFLLILSPMVTEAFIYFLNEYVVLILIGWIFTGRWWPGAYGRGDSDDIVGLGKESGLKTKASDPDSISPRPGPPVRRTVRLSQQGTNIRKSEAQHRPTIVESLPMRRSVAVRTSKTRKTQQQSSNTNEAQKIQNQIQTPGIIGKPNTDLATSASTDLSYNPGSGNEYQLQDHDIENQIESESLFLRPLPYMPWMLKLWKRMIFVHTILSNLILPLFGFLATSDAAVKRSQQDKNYQNDSVSHGGIIILIQDNYEYDPFSYSVDIFGSLYLLSYYLRILKYVQPFKLIIWVICMKEILKASSTVYTDTIVLSSSESSQSKTIKSRIKRSCFDKTLICLRKTQFAFAFLISFLFTMLNLFVTDYEAIQFLTGVMQLTVLCTVVVGQSQTFFEYREAIRGSDWNIENYVKPITQTPGNTKSNVIMESEDQVTTLSIINKDHDYTGPGNFKKDDNVITNKAHDQNLNKIDTLQTNLFVPGVVFSNSDIVSQNQNLNPNVTNDVNLNDNESEGSDQNLLDNDLENQSGSATHGKKIRKKKRGTNNNLTQTVTSNLPNLPSLPKTLSKNLKNRSKESRQQSKESNASKLSKTSTDANSKYEVIQDGTQQGIVVNTQVGNFNDQSHWSHNINNVNIQADSDPTQSQTSPIFIYNITTTVIIAGLGILGNTLMRPEEVFRFTMTTLSSLFNMKSFSKSSPAVIILYLNLLSSWAIVTSFIVCSIIFGFVKTQSKSNSRLRKIQNESESNKTNSNLNSDFDQNLHTQQAKQQQYYRFCNLRNGVTLNTMVSFFTWFLELSSALTVWLRLDLFAENSEGNGGTSSDGTSSIQTFFITLLTIVTLDIYKDTEFWMHLDYIMFLSCGRRNKGLGKRGVKPQSGDNSNKNLDTTNANSHDEYMYDKRGFLVREFHTRMWCLQSSYCIKMGYFSAAVMITTELIYRVIHGILSGSSQVGGDSPQGFLLLASLSKTANRNVASSSISNSDTNSTMSTMIQKSLHNPTFSPLLSNYQSLLEDDSSGPLGLGPLVGRIITWCLLLCATMTQCYFTERYNRRKIVGVVEKLLELSKAESQSDSELRYASDLWKEGSIYLKAAVIEEIVDRPWRTFQAVWIPVGFLWCVAIYLILDHVAIVRL